MHKKIKLGIFLFFIGFIGVLSLLTMDIPLPENIEKMIADVFTPWQFKLLSLINPTIYLLVAVILGTLFYDKVNFKLPLIESLIYKTKTAAGLSILKYGIVGGIIGGGLIAILSLAFIPILPNEFIELGEKFKSGLAVRFLYGGLTEEILMRFGLVSFFVWLMFKITGKLNPSIYWIGIVTSAVLFGLGHLPIVFMLIEKPTLILILYIILANTAGGIVFGWLYWKQGLEAAMIAHIFAHIVMLAGS